MEQLIRDSLIGHAARRIAPHNFRFPDEIAAAAEKNLYRSSTSSSPRTPPNDSDSWETSPADDSRSPLESNRPPDNTVDEIDAKPILCDWNSEEDPENPRNWSRARKLFVVANVAFCSFVVYGTAPIWTPSTEAFMFEYGTGHEYTSLGLSLFV
jgi:DHA1 family multidrug resistance protein-like MFS transporter